MPAQTRPVVRATAVCADAPGDKDTQSWVAVAAPGVLEAGAPIAPSGGAGDGAELSELGSDSALMRLTTPSADLVKLPPQPAPVARPGTPAAQPQASARPLAAVGQGALSPGFGVSVLTRTVRGDLRGLASAACPPAGSEFWFVGSGAVIGQRGRLFLTNPAATPAVVDVLLYGPSGPIQIPATRGLIVGPGQQEELLLDALSPTTPRFGIHIRVRQGRVAVALNDSQVRGLDARGTDWVPPAIQPARRVIIPGVPRGGGQRLLQVLAPGRADAIVRLRLMAEDGSFVPRDADVLEVPGGSVAELDLTAALGGMERGIELTSDVPVTAGVLVRTLAGRGQVEELAYTSANPALTVDQPGVVPLAVTPAPATTRLTLSAPMGNAAVTIRTLPPARVSSARVTVPQGGQVSVSVPRSEGDVEGTAVVIIPDRGSGPVVAARITEEASRFGSLLTISPVPPGRYVVRVPRVHPDLFTGLGRGTCLTAC